MVMHVALRAPVLPATQTPLQSLQCPKPGGLCCLRDFRSVRPPFWRTRKVGGWRPSLELLQAASTMNHELN